MTSFALKGWSLGHLSTPWCEQWEPKRLKHYERLRGIESIYWTSKVSAIKSNVLVNWKQCVNFAIINNFKLQLRTGLLHELWISVMQKQWKRHELWFQAYWPWYFIINAVPLILQQNQWLFWHTANIQIAVISAFCSEAGLLLLQSP